jgi:hypothetical protein
MVVRLCPLTKMAFDSLKKGTHGVTREGKEWEVHRLAFKSGIQAMILPQDEAI